MQDFRQVEPQIDPGILLNWVRGESFYSLFQSELKELSHSLQVSLDLNISSFTRAEAHWLASRWLRRHQDHAVRTMDPVRQKRYITDDFGRFVQEMVQEEHILKLDAPNISTGLPTAVKVWPTGFCVYVAMMRLCQSATGSNVTAWKDLPAIVLDPATWQSIHENVIEDINTARPFLAYLLGMVPVWHDWNLSDATTETVADKTRTESFKGRGF